MTYVHFLLIFFVLAIYFVQLLSSVKFIDRDILTDRLLNMLRIGKSKKALTYIRVCSFKKINKTNIFTHVNILTDLSYGLCFGKFVFV